MTASYKAVPSRPPGQRQRSRATLIDFAAPVAGDFEVRQADCIRCEAVTVSRCRLPANEGREIGSTQLTLAIHDSAPIDFEWRQPETGQLDRKRIVLDDAHLNPPDRPIFQRWTGSASILVIAWEASFVRGVSDSVFNGTVDLPTRIGLRDTVVRQMAATWRSELNQGAPGGALFTESLASVLAIHLMRTYGNGVQPQFMVKGGLAPARLRRVIDYIEAHLDCVLHLNDLARVAELSPHHFANTFKAATGSPPHRYLMERRIHRARELLLDRRRSIASVASDVGFANQSHFTNSFKKVTGATPLRFRLITG